MRIFNGNKGLSLFVIPILFSLFIFDAAYCANSENAKDIAGMVASKKSKTMRNSGSRLDYARSLYNQKRYGEAIGECNDLLSEDKDNQPAKSLLRYSEAKQAAEIVAGKIAVKRKNTQRIIDNLDNEFIELFRRPEEYDKNRDIKLKKNIETLKVFWRQGKYHEALDVCEKMKTHIPSDLHSRVKINELIEDMRKFAEDESEIVERDRILDVRKAWVPPVNQEEDDDDETPADNQIISVDKQELIAKSNRIIPEINFKNAHLRDVIQYLSKISGVNIILDESLYVVQDDTQQTQTVQEDDRITIELKNIPLLEALKYILITKSMKYRIEDHAIWIARNVDDVEMVTRTYQLPSGTGVQRLLKYDGQSKQEEIDGDSTIETGGDITQLLKEAVPFPPGSKIFLDPRTSTLLVTNTVANHSLIEDVLKSLSKPPIQVQIEAKFVKIREDDANELGLEMFLTKDWNVSGGKPTDPRVLSDTTDATYGQFAGAPTGQYGLTRGLRFSGSDSSIFRFSGVLTEPQFSVILHALSQNRITDVISAPKLTVINGQQAIIKDVTEIIYPLEFSITQATYNDNGNAITPSVVTVGDFQTRKTGIVLSVTPNLGSDSRTITLTIMPEVSSVQTWINYGTVSAPMQVPHFQTENVVTTVIINDGDTVVMGGLLKEEVTKVHDKIPVLGDIPYVGRAFRSDREQSVKTNLLVFVTAKIINPSGSNLGGMVAKKEK